MILQFNKLISRSPKHKYPTPATYTPNPDHIGSISDLYWRSPNSIPSDVTIFSSDVTILFNAFLNATLKQIETSLKIVVNITRPLFYYPHPLYHITHPYFNISTPTWHYSLHMWYYHKYHDIIYWDPFGPTMTSSCTDLYMTSPTINFSLTICVYF